MTSFDPYHVWLGIPPGEQPPNHYRLLAIAPFEDSPDVIENAADRQMAHVRRAATGKHGELSQQILGEIAAARRCLLDPQRKQAYDADLRTTEPTATPAGVAATMEWQPTAPAKPPKPPAPPPPRTEEGQTPQRWKGSRQGDTPSPSPPAPPNTAVQVDETAPAVAVKTAASPTLARARKQSGRPAMLLTLVAALAVAPIILLLAVIWSMSGPTVAAGDDTDAGEVSPPATTTSADDAEDDSLPTLPQDDDTGGDLSSGVDDDEVDEPFDSRPPRRRFPKRPRRTDGDRDPFDETPSFGRTSGDPLQELSFDLSAKTTMIELAKLRLPPHTGTKVLVKTGQIVRLKMSGQCHVGTQPHDLRGPDGVWVAVGPPNGPATQFFRGSSDMEFAVIKGGRLFLALDDLIPADNRGSLAVEVAVYE